MLVRREQPGDRGAVREIVAAAFAPTGAPAGIPVEVTLLDELRADDGWLPSLSLVAVDPAGGRPVGHVVCTRGAIDGAPALGLGPLAVRPDRQGQGIGSALVHAVLGAAEVLEEPVVALLGEPGYYGRFGFRPASEHGIAAPDPAWGAYFQVRVLADRPPTGTFAYAAPFARV